MISNSVSLFKSPLRKRDSAYIVLRFYLSFLFFLHKWAIHLFILLMGFDYFHFDRVNHDSFFVSLFKCPLSNRNDCLFAIVSMLSFKRVSAMNCLLQFFPCYCSRYSYNYFPFISCGIALNSFFIFSNQISNFTQYPWSRWNFFPLFTFPHIICRRYPWRIKTYAYLLNFCSVNPLIWFSLLLNRGRLFYITLVRLYTCLFIFNEIPIVSFDFQYFFIILKYSLHFISLNPVIMICILVILVIYSVLYG